MLIEGKQLDEFAAIETAGGRIHYLRTIVNNLHPRQFSVNVIAPKIGMSHMGLYMLEKNQRMPRQSTLEKIADFFHVDPRIFTYPVLEPFTFHVDGVNPEIPLADNNNFASRLTAVRKIYQLSLSDLSRLSGVDLPMLSKLESGQVGSPKLTTLLQISKGLQITVSQLIGESEIIVQPSMDETTRLALQKIIAELTMLTEE